MAKPTKSQKTRDIWYRLDNAATIYPSVSDKKNTNVYRLCCELNEFVARDVLQQALDTAMKAFPYFRVVMRRGLFWYYLERSELSPQVEYEAQRPCAPIFHNHIKELLIRVNYYNRRINLEVFHSVADGGGAIQLLNTILYHYILLRHGDELPAGLPAPQVETSPSHMTEDSFGHHYDPSDRESPFKRRAYTIAGTLLPRGNIHVIEATMPASQIVELCKTRGVTVTAYLAALQIYSIYKELMPRRFRSRPIGLIVPVDLRGHFASETSRNFFSVVEVGYHFAKNPDDFDSVLTSVSEQLRQKLNRNALSARLGYTMSAQKNIFARFTPLVLKNIVLKLVYRKAETATTSALSNMGRIAAPDFFAPYINRYVCLLNPTSIHRAKVCVCSFGEQLVVAFTSCIAETKAEKYFIRHLAQQGVDICLTCNGGSSDEVL